jgi:hypothetical protein
LQYASTALIKPERPAERPRLYRLRSRSTRPRQDASHLYENFEQRRPFPIVVDVEATLRTYDKLEALATSRRHVIPGHDPLVVKRYPALNERTEGIVHRLDVPRIDQA